MGPAVLQYSTRGSPYSRGGFFRGTARGRGGGHNVNRGTAFRGASSAPTRGINRWEAFSGQSQIQAEAQASNNPRQLESPFAPESVSVAGDLESESSSELDINASARAIVGGLPKF